MIPSLLSFLWGWCWCWTCRVGWRLPGFEDGQRCSWYWRWEKSLLLRQVYSSNLGTVSSEFQASPGLLHFGKSTCHSVFSSHQTFCWSLDSVFQPMWDEISRDIPSRCCWWLLDFQFCFHFHFSSSETDCCQIWCWFSLNPSFTRAILVQSVCFRSNFEFRQVLIRRKSCWDKEADLCWHAHTPQCMNSRGYSYIWTEFKKVGWLLCTGR